MHDHMEACKSRGGSKIAMFSRLRRRHDVGRRERLVELFNRMDCNGDRILHMNEVNEYLQRHRYDPSAIREFWRTFDLNQDGQITAEEFNMVLARLPDDSVDIDNLRRVFSSFDTDSSGRLEVTEVMSFITCMFNLNECFFGLVFASFKAEYRRSRSVQDLNRPFQTNILRIQHLKKMSL
uniref:EF-hand domain-containing protein n=1 Tax=Echinococcus canadensis TaxID=519352 RepID=A0A915EYR0_9CEST